MLVSVVVLPSTGANATPRKQFAYLTISDKRNLEQWTMRRNAFRTRWQCGNFFSFFSLWSFVLGAEKLHPALFTRIRQRRLHWNWIEKIFSYLAIIKIPKSFSICFRFLVACPTALRHYRVLLFLHSKLMNARETAETVNEKTTFLSFFNLVFINV